MGFVRRELEQIHRTYFNRTPQAVDDTVAESISEDADGTVIDVLSNDIDRDRGDIKTVTGVTNGTYGTVTTDGTTVTYTPNEAAKPLATGETATDTFTYTVSDAESAPHLHGFFGLFSRGHTDTATVTVTLTGVNDAPSVVGDNPNVREDGVLEGVLPVGTDVDGGTLTYAIVERPTNGAIVSFDANTGAYTYKPNLNYNGPDSFTYVANDGTADSAKATITIGVNPVNDNPVSNPDTLGINENAGATVIQVLRNDSDVDGDSLKITSVTPGTTPLGNVTFTDSTVTYTPNAAALTLNTGQVGTDSFTYTVSDGNEGTATGTVTVTVTGVSDTTVVSTGTHTPVEIGVWGDTGLIRNADGTFTRIEYDVERGWVVGADYATDIDAGAFDLDARMAYAWSNEDGSLTLLDRDTGAVIGRATDAETGLTYRFDDVTDVAVDRRTDVVQADVAYLVQRDGTLYEVDARSRVVLRRVDTGVRTRATATTLMAADTAAATVSPRLAVAKGGATVYVANGNRIAVVKRQTAVAARAAADSDAVATAAGDLVYDESLDLSLDGEVTALETSADGKHLYATVESVDAAGRTVSRLQAISVAEDGTLTRAASVEVASGARSLAVNDELNRAYVVSDADVAVIGLGNLDVIRRVDAGAAGAVVAVAAQRDAVLVTNPDAHAVAVVSDSPITIELDWGAVPRDLDAHLIGPSGDGMFHVYFAQPTYNVSTEDGAQEVGAFLNVDDQDGDGPEIIQIDTRTPGLYHYFVVNWSGETDFAEGTSVTILDPRSGISQTVDVSDATGSGRYWSVFTVTVSDTGTVTVATANELSNDNPDPNVPPPPGSQISL